MNRLMQVRADEEAAVGALSVALEHLVNAADPETVLPEVFDAILAIPPTRTAFAASVALVKILGNLLLDVPQEHRPRGTRAMLIRSRRFILAHRDYLGEAQEIILDGLGARRQ